MQNSWHALQTTQKKTLTSPIGARRALDGIEVEGDDCYLPTAPDKLVVDIIRDSGVALQSAAKAPFLLVFDVRDRGGDPTAIHPQGCIFKVGLGWMVAVFFGSQMVNAKEWLSVFPFRELDNGGSCVVWKSNGWCGPAG